MTGTRQEDARARRTKPSRAAGGDRGDEKTTTRPGRQTLPDQPQPDQPMHDPVPSRPPPEPQHEVPPHDPPVVPERDARDADDAAPDTVIFDENRQAR